MFDRDPLISRPQIISGDRLFKQGSGSCKTLVSFRFQLSGSSSAPNVSTGDVSESLNKADDLYDELKNQLERRGAFNRIQGAEVQTGGNFGSIDIATTDVIDVSMLDSTRDMAFRIVEDYLDKEWKGNFNLRPSSDMELPEISVEETTRNLPRF